MSEGNGISDERIGKGVIKKVIKEELKEVPESEGVPPLDEVEGQTEHEKKIVDQLAHLIKLTGDNLQNNQEIQDAIDGMACIPGPGSKGDRFLQVAKKVIEAGITWERIAVLFYVAGKLAVKMVMIHLPQSVTDILKWTVDFFKNHLLSWICDHGGWISSFSDLALLPVQNVSPFSLQVSVIVVIFIAGMAAGCFITRRLGKGP